VALALGVTALSLIVLGLSFRRGRSATLATPQFTRHEMRQREE